MIDDLENRFRHHPPKSGQVADRHEAWRADCRSLAERAGQLMPVGRELAIVIRSIEDAMMWGNAAIARNQ